MEKLNMNFYLPIAKTDEEIDLVKTYGDLHDPHGWTISDCKKYCLTNLIDSNVTGYSKDVAAILKVKKGNPIIMLTFEEFAIATGVKQPKKELKQESSNLPANILTIENIEKVLLKYIGEQESDDIINELKLLS